MLARSRSIGTGVALGTLTLLMTSTPCVAQIESTPIVLTGSVAPGTNGSLFESVPRSTAASSDGVVYFTGRLEQGTGDTTLSNRDGLWRYDGAQIDLIVRQGDVAPGTGGATFSTFESLIVNGPEVLIFEALLNYGPPGVDLTNDLGLWMLDGTGITLLAREGSDAPGTGGADFDRFDSIAINRDGSYAFVGRLQPGENGVIMGFNDTCLWAQRDGSLQFVARIGMDAPEFPGIRFRFFEGLSPRGNGEFSFWSFLSGPGGFRQGIWETDDGSLRALAAASLPAPGLPGAIFDEFGFPGSNGTGDLTFTASIDGPAGNCSPGLTLYRVAGDAVELVAVCGDDAPGTTGAFLAPTSFSTSSMNEAGSVAFTAQVDDEVTDEPGNSAGVWLHTADGLELIARRNDPELMHVPFPEVTGISTLILNERNDLTITTREFDGSVFYRYLWVHSRALGRTFRVAQCNVPFVVNTPGGGADVREVISGGFFAIDDNGLCYFVLGFVDGSGGIFTARVPDSTAGCPGDCDSSGIIDFNDLVAILFEFGQAVAPACDPDQTGTADFNDLVTALFLFGECP